MPKQIKGGLYYSVAEAANELNVSERSVHQYISEGRLPAETINRSVVILEEDLFEFKANWTKWKKTR